MTTTDQPQQGERPMPRPPWVSRGRVPCLDGLRAVAITLVVLSHRAPSPGAESFLRVMGLFSAGHLGVTVFFVLSGFLITLLLLREHSDNGRVSLRKFYVRRGLRLVPAYGAYLVCVAVLVCGGWIRLPGRFWVAALTYTMCFMPYLQRGWQLAHLWSLSVEEHFYLIWPLLLVALKPKRALALIAVYVVASPLIRYLIWWKFPHALDIDYCSPSQMESIATGCLLAGLVHLDKGLRFLAFLRAYAGRVAMIGLIGLALSIAMARILWRFDVLFGDPSNAFFIAIIMAGLLFMRDGVVNRVLNAKSVVLVGVLSYSIYLWQQLFMTRSTYWACRWPVNVILALAAAGLSYAFIEMPFLRIKGRFAPRRFPQAPTREGDRIGDGIPSAIVRAAASE